MYAFRQCLYYVGRLAVNFSRTVTAQNHFFFEISRKVGLTDWEQKRHLPKLRFSLHTDLQCVRAAPHLKVPPPLAFSEARNTLYVRLI